MNKGRILAVNSANSLQKKQIRQNYVKEQVQDLLEFINCSLVSPSLLARSMDELVNPGSLTLDLFEQHTQRETIKIPMPIMPGCPPTVQVSKTSRPVLD